MSKQKYSEKFYEISFSDKISKQAYLNACKWLAKNVYSKVELSKYVSVQIIKDTERQLPTFTVILYITVDEKEMKDNYCSKCKNLHTIMYAIDKPNCSSCKMEGYRRYMDNDIKNLVAFWKEVFDCEEQI